MTTSTALLLPYDIGPGPDREIQILLADHMARCPLRFKRWPATAACASAKIAYVLSPGVLVPVDAHTLHNVQATLTSPSWSPSFARLKCRMDRTPPPSLSNPYRAVTHVKNQLVPACASFEALPVLVAVSGPPPRAASLISLLRIFATATP
jgi:hypothetical protein